jgi:hypothetical protein
VETVIGSVLIVPAALAIVGAAARRIVMHVEDGGMLILESGATFAAAGSPEFLGHRDALRELFGLDIEPARALVRTPRIPYVHFRWPSPALVRDFSAIVPVEPCDDDEGIARVGETTVALARRRGRGTLIFLGSPMGPALWAGDTEARRWLREVLRLAHLTPSVVA